MAQSGRPGRSRTCNPRIRNPMLYPLELRALNTGILATDYRGSAPRLHCGKLSSAQVPGYSGFVAAGRSGQSRGLPKCREPNLSAVPWFDRHGRKSQLLTAVLAPGAWSSPVRSNTRRARLLRSTIALPFALPIAGWGWGRAGRVAPTWGREATKPEQELGPS